MLSVRNHSVVVAVPQSDPNERTRGSTVNEPACIRTTQTSSPSARALPAATSAAWSNDTSNEYAAGTPSLLAVISIGVRNSNVCGSSRSPSSGGLVGEPLPVVPSLEPSKPSPALGASAPVSLLVFVSLTVPLRGSVHPTITQNTEMTPLMNERSMRFRSDSDGCVRPVIGFNL